MKVFTKLSDCLRRVVLIASLLLSGCEAVKAVAGIKPANVWLEKITFKADDNMNDDSPVTVHVVIPYKDELEKKLSAMDAATYFKQAKKIKSDAGDDLDVFSVDIIPGATDTVLEITPRSSLGLIALMFARYSTPGDHRTNVSADYELQVDMGAHDLKVNIIKTG